MNFPIERGWRYLVIGDPVAHSRSPGMQNAAFAALGLGRPYGKLHVLPGQLGDFVDFARKHLAGVNLTVPHKRAVLPFLDEIDPEAARGESVNTLIVRDGRVFGTSTDGYGLAAALKWNFNFEVDGGRFLFLGAGGVAHATAFYLACRGARRIAIANRSVGRANELAAGVSLAYPACETASVALETVAGLAAEFAAADCVIQATSVGLHDDDPAPVRLDNLEHCRRDCVIFDTIYKDTALLRRASELGLRCSGGREMLIGQGAKSFELWTGLTPPLDAMRRGFDADFGDAGGSRC